MILAGAAAWWMYALVAVESAVSTLMRPVQNSLLPELARTPAELTATNLALSVIESAGVFLGPLLGAVLLHAIDLGAVFLVSAGAYLAAALLLLPIKARPMRMTLESGRACLFVGAVAGIRAMTADRNVAIVVLLYGAQNLVAGALNVVIVVIALKLLQHRSLLPHSGHGCDASIPPTRRTRRLSRCSGRSPSSSRCRSHPSNTSRSHWRRRRLLQASRCSNRGIRVTPST